MTDSNRVAGLRSRPASSAPRPLSLLGLADLYRKSLIASVLVFLVAGLAIGYNSPVTYTAQGQMLAAGTSVEAAAVPSFTQAGQSLAQTYSRVFMGDAVRKQLLAKGYDPAKETVTASPIAASSVILIEATAPSADGAARLADEGITALGSTVKTLLDNREQVADTRAQMVGAYKEQAEAQSKIDQLDKRKVSQNSTAYGQAIAQLSEAQANAESLRTLLATQVSNSVAANGVAPLTSASVVSDTSRQRYQLWGAIGLVAGVGLWLLVALIRSGRARREAALRRPLGS